jgi:hypothetical protein
MVDLAEVGCASIACRNGAPFDFLPLPLTRAFLARQESLWSAVLR